MHYQRPSITPHEAVRRLCAKGLTISDPVATEKFICFVGYFRLRGFCLPFMQKAPDGFLHGSRVFHHGVHWQTNMAHSGMPISKMALYIKRLTTWIG